MSPLAPLAALQARLEKPLEAWRHLEQHLGRGLLDELVARDNILLTTQENEDLLDARRRLQQLDKLLEAAKATDDTRFPATELEKLRQLRDRSSVLLAELQLKLAAKYGPAAGEVYELDAIQAAIPADAVLITWVDVEPAAPNAADPNGEHWGLVVRKSGSPIWLSLVGEAGEAKWTEKDSQLPARLRRLLVRRTGTKRSGWRTVAERLRRQRIDPLLPHLGPTADGLPAVRRLVVLPSSAMQGVPVEVLTRPSDGWVISRGG
jgi:hypothetical protein